MFLSLLSSLSMMLLVFLALFVLDLDRSSSSSPWLSLRLESNGTERMNTNSLLTFPNLDIGEASSVVVTDSDLSTSLPKSVVVPRIRSRRRRRLFDTKDQYRNLLSEDEEVEDSKDLIQNSTDATVAHDNSVGHNIIVLWPGNSSSNVNVTNATDDCSNEATEGSSQSNQPTDEEPDTGSFVSFYLMAMLLVIAVFAWNTSEFLRNSLEHRLHLQEEQQRAIREQEAALDAILAKEKILTLSEEEFNDLPIMTLQIYLDEYDYDNGNMDAEMETANSNDNNINKIPTIATESKPHLTPELKSSDVERGMPAVELVTSSIHSLPFTKRNSSLSEINNALQTTTPPSSVHSEENEAATTTGETNTISDGDVEIGIPGACSMKSITCSICVDEIQCPDEIVLMLPRCRHIYHTDCIKQWLMEQKSDFCPICKVTVKKEIESR